jgi:ketosteroid isomerase-like protein
VTGLSGSEKKSLVVDRWFPSMLANDEATMASLLAEQVDYWCPPSTSGHIPYVNGPELAAFIAEAAPKLYATREWTWHAVVAEGDLVALRGTLRATTQAGNSYENDYQWMFRFENDLIKEMWEVMDTIPYLKAVGRLEKVINDI